MATIKFSIPDVPYSQLEFDPEEIEAAMALESALRFRSAFLTAFPQKHEGPSQRPTQRQVTNGAPRNGNGAQQTHSGLFCPDHPSVELIPSKAEYQEYSYDVNGNQQPDKFFCPGKENGDKNHSVWRSRALTREVVEDLPF